MKYKKLPLKYSGTYKNINQNSEKFNFHVEADETPEATNILKII